MTIGFWTALAVDAAGACAVIVTATWIIRDREPSWSVPSWGVRTDQRWILPIALGTDAAFGVLGALLDADRALWVAFSAVMLLQGVLVTITLYLARRHVQRRAHSSPTKNLHVN